MNFLTILVYADFISLQCQAGNFFKSLEKCVLKKYVKFTRNLLLAGGEYANIWNNRALGDKFLKFGMVLGMGSVFSKSIANKMGVTSGDLLEVKFKMTAKTT